MMETLENQDRMIQELSKNRSHDEALKERLDEFDFHRESFAQQVVKILVSNATSVVLSEDFERPQASLETDLMNAMQNSPQQMEEDDLLKLKMSPKRLARVRYQFIDIFRYDSMLDRESGVAEAHPETLKWIFETPRGETHTWDNFSQWIESEDKLYWITGKMGSGKSTLMKYISQRLPETSAVGIVRRCTPHLIRWAQNRPLFIATFYFWAGSSEDTRIQTSVEGLYRTLLTQILEAYPESAPRVSPRRWESLCLFNKRSKAPRITELKLMLSKAIEYVCSVAKVCLFIDGLDEFEGEDDELHDLVNWIKILVETSPIKLCVASRPWRIFEDALQDRPHLLMEDFNFKDIQMYVWRRFHDDPNFRARKQMEAGFCDQLLDEIVTKAEGVFLWVQLVCTRLLQAMSRGDLVGDLRQILEALPVQMEKLYDHILNNLDLKDYAAKYFLLLKAISGRPDTIIFSFADEIDHDSEFSLKLPKSFITGAELQYRVTELRKRLNSRCRGLLSVSMELDHSVKGMSTFDMGTVQYCHRSAKNYLEMDSIQAKLVNMLEVPFDPHLRLCSAYLAQSKHYPIDGSRPVSPSEASVWSACIYRCAEHAARVSSESYDMMIRVLDDLGPEIETQAYIDEVHFAPSPWFGGNPLSFAVVLGVKEYVRRKVGRGQRCVVGSSSVYLGATVWAIPGTSRWRLGLNKTRAGSDRMKEFRRRIRDEKVEWPLLLDALLSVPQPDPEMVSLLLENGADPNLIVRCAGWQESALDVILARVLGKQRYTKDVPEDPIWTSADTKRAWVDSVCLLLRHGAKPHRSDVQSLRKFIGEDMIHGLKLPHLGRHREFVSKHLAYAGFGW